MADPTVPESEVRIVTSAASVLGDAINQNGWSLRDHIGCVVLHHGQATPCIHPAEHLHQLAQFVLSNPLTPMSNLDMTMSEHMAHVVLSAVQRKPQGALRVVLLDYDRKVGRLFFTVQGSQRPNGGK